jgi:pseudouridine-5'-phosphate glycosidase
VDPAVELPPYFHLSEEAAQALSSGRPVVALESTVITHGLPYPQNITLAKDMEMEVRHRGGVPATIAVLDGVVTVGLDSGSLERLGGGGDVHKISSRDLGVAITQKWSGGTTVAGTLSAAHIAGIRVFATGGIGGVHRGGNHDVSADLLQLARTPLIVVCAGAKAILDLPATLEYLETFSVPVAGYQTDEFPAFYSKSSGLKVNLRVNSPREAVEIATAHWGLGFSSALLVANPPPDEHALQKEVVDGAIQTALAEAESQGIRGQSVTPFLLARVSELTSGASLETNLELLKNNARLAADIASALAER